ncbi:MAG TPA: FAD-dependent oxidoreductase [Myxococcota bacterium]|nr:FAD-dependent oxidoreductase [Myxococcota bacterium]
MGRTLDALDLVLVGGGHAHVQVLRRLALAPLPRARVTVVLDRPEAVYSGMVPGFAAGEYAMRELEIDVARLAQRAGAALVLAPATRVDAARRRIEVEGHAPLDFDLASLDVGSSLRGLELPGVREHALPTRPIRDFVDRLDARLAACARADAPIRVAVVGAGAAGVELAFCLEARIRRDGRRADVSLIDAEREPLAALPPALRRRARAEAQRRGVALRTGSEVTGVAPDALWLGDERLPADLVVWASGAAPWPWLRESALPLDAQGFVRVRPTLQVVGCEALFAVGDCASLDGAPWVPKAGVYAVREGPPLERNLRACVAGAEPRAYRPQREFLALLNLGDGRALGSKWGFAVQGGAVWQLKNHIDRAFVQRFRVA